MKLTARQQAVLDFLRRFQAERGYPPTRAEVARAFGFSQARSAEDHLRALAARGAVALEPGTSRGIRLLPAANATSRVTRKDDRNRLIAEELSDLKRFLQPVRGPLAEQPADVDAPQALRPGPELLVLPLVGRVAAGAPILSDAHVADHYALDPRLFRPRPQFLLRVEGDSMREAGILDGDLIAVRQTPVADPGQVVVARLDDEITVKRLRRDDDGHLWLDPANPDYAPIPVEPLQQAFAIEGVLVGVVRRG